MTRRTRYDEPDDEYDPDGSDEYDAYRDYDPEDTDTYPAGVYADPERPTVPCPYCKREIDEEAERCPHCENYISKEDPPREGRSSVWAVLMVLALLAAAFWVVAG